MAQGYSRCELLLIATPWVPTKDTVSTHGTRSPEDPVSSPCWLPSTCKPENRHRGSSVLSGPGSQAAHLKLLKTHLLHLGDRTLHSSNRTPQSGCLALITQGCVGTASPALPGTRQSTETCITSLRKNHTQNPDHPDGQPVENPQVKMSPAAEGSPLCRWKPQPGTV